MIFLCLTGLWTWFPKVYLLRITLTWTANTVQFWLMKFSLQLLEGFLIFSYQTPSAPFRNTLHIFGPSVVFFLLWSTLMFSLLFSWNFVRWALSYSWSSYRKRAASWPITLSMVESVTPNSISVGLPLVGLLLHGAEPIRGDGLNILSAIKE